MWASRSSRRIFPSPDYSKYLRNIIWQRFDCSGQCRGVFDKIKGRVVRISLQDPDTFIRIAPVHAFIIATNEETSMHASRFLRSHKARLGFAPNGNLSRIERLEAVAPSHHEHRLQNPMKEVVSGMLVCWRLDAVALCLAASPR